MYTMLIVDDEYLVREGISKTIQWSKYNIEIVALAVNGIDGLKKINEYRPDIIITDVKMPVMDGIELTRRLCDECYDGAIVVLSGYNDFEYAKATFENGVYNYLLKPVDNDELIGCVLNVLEKLIDRRKTRLLVDNVRQDLPRVKQRVFSDLIHGRYDKLSVNEMCKKLSAYGMTVIARGVVVYCKAQSSASEEATRQSLLMLESRVLEALSEYNIFTDIESMRLCVLTECTNIELIERLLWDILHMHEKDNDIVFSVGISNVFEQLDGVSKAFATAKLVSQNQLFCTINNVTVQNNAQGKYYKKHVMDAMSIIAEEFSTNNLSVAFAADKLNVSESYLMHLFKDNLGKTFNTCVTEYRIMMAKKYLMEQQYRISEIAELVGYWDVKYFGQVFRKIVGCTPSEYVKKELSKKQPLREEKNGGG